MTDDITPPPEGTPADIFVPPGVEPVPLPDTPQNVPPQTIAPQSVTPPTTLVNLGSGVSPPSPVVLPEHPAIKRERRFLILGIIFVALLVLLSALVYHLIAHVPAYSTNTTTTTSTSTTTISHSTSTTSTATTISNISSTTTISHNTSSTSSSTTSISSITTPTTVTIPPNLIGKVLNASQAFSIVAKNAPSAECYGAGKNFIIVAPPIANVDVHNILANAITLLSGVGGGTILLERGTYQMNESLNINESNIAIVGQGENNTILSLPKNPGQNFYNYQGGNVVGTNQTLHTTGYNKAINFVQVQGPVSNGEPAPVNNLAICNVSFNAQVNSTATDWIGSVIFDNTGGNAQFFDRINFINLYGPGGPPNGLNIGCHQNPCIDSGATNYVITNLTAINNTLKYNGSSGRSGPDFLVLHALSNAKVTNINGIGFIEFDGAPTVASLFENWNVRGHMLIDPALGGSWDGSTFDNVSFNSSNSGKKYVLTLSEPGTPGHANFTYLYFDNCFFYGGQITGLGNAYSVQNCTFAYVYIDSVPAFFVNNNVTDAMFNRTKPIYVGGPDYAVTNVIMTGNKWHFINGTNDTDPFEILANSVTWSGDHFYIAQPSTGYLFSARSVLSSSDFKNLVYTSIGAGPATINMIDISNSAGFVNNGITVGKLTNLINNLPI
jgi:hypothetical protein